MPCLLGRVAPVVGATIAIANRCGDEVGGLEIVERRDVDGDVLGGIPFGGGNPTVGHDAAVFAEAGVTRGGAGLSRRYGCQSP